MTTSFRHTGLPILAMLLACSAASAAEIYHWVDDAGVAHYSQLPPPANQSVEVETRRLAVSTPDDYDPHADEYSVLKQAERIHAAWSELEAERAARRDERRDESPADRGDTAWQDEPYGGRHGWRYGREIHYPAVYRRHPPFRPARKMRRHQFESLDEIGLWREPPAYSINSTRHWQRVQQSRALTLP